MRFSKERGEIALNNVHPRGGCFGELSAVGMIQSHVKLIGMGVGGR